MRFVLLLSAVYGSISTVDRAVDVLKTETPRAAEPQVDDVAEWEEAVEALFMLLSRVTDSQNTAEAISVDGGAAETARPDANASADSGITSHAELTADADSETTPSPEEFAPVKTEPDHEDPQAGQPVAFGPGTAVSTDQNEVVQSSGAQVMSRDRSLPFAELRPYDGVSLGTPLSYSISRAYMSSLGPDMAPRFRKRIEMDNVNLASLPLLEFDIERLPLPDGRVLLLKVEEFIARSFEGTVATVAGRPDLVIKYQSNCDNLREVHPLMRDYMFLSAIADLNISPRPFFLSPPTKLTELVTPKTRFRMPNSFRRGCAGVHDSAVRYMVMERVGISVSELIYRYELRGTVIPLQEAVTAMSQAIVGIQAIHARGIVHGDIHSGNLVILERNGEQSIGFIDFGLAFYLSENRPAIRYRPMKEAHCLFSHWNTEGYRFSMRDDVFKILLAGAYMMNGQDWLDFCMSLESDAERMVQWKRERFIFRVPGKADFSSRLGHLSLETQRGIGQNLDKALRLARSVEGLDDVPPYQEILAALATVWQLLQVHP